MRVLFATSIKTWGGGEKWMLGAARGLAERGHATTVAARPGSAIAVRAHEEGVEVLPVAFRSDADVPSFLRVWLWCRRRRPDALVLNMDRVLRVAGPAARAAGVPAVLPRRGSEFPLKDGPLYRWTYRRVATGVIVNSRATARTLVEGVDWRPAGRIHVLLNGVAIPDSAAIRPRERTRQDLGLTPDDPVIVAVGELTARKNFGLLLDALPPLVDAHPRLTVLVAGEGEERARLEDRIAELGLGERFRLLGFRRDVPDLLAAADLLVHPARVEGFGYAPAEAMAAGLPVVASDASSLPEIVRNGETGILVVPDDVEALRSAIGTYLDDPARRARDGAAGRERVRREFSPRARLDELEEILGANRARSA
jgi:glycosyltransferase involved in cell wall biosynthesis